jgi:hypothetical protein
MYETTTIVGTVPQAGQKPTSQPSPLQQAQQDQKDVASVYTWQSPEVKAPQTQVQPLTPNDNQFIPTSSGQVSKNLPAVPQTKASASLAQTPQEIIASLAETAKVGDKVEETVNQFEHATGSVDAASTVQGQLGDLMQQFENGQTPAWASGAIRRANTIMAQRGISSSSMAGQAVLQAAMEAALPIAQQDAQTNFAMQMANLNNEQQKLMQKNQARTEALFTDTAAENAMRQFNAANQNQMKQFNANLRTQVDQFNASQLTAISQFNAGQANAISMFKAQMQDQREQFNAANRLIIDQANARWRQQIATQNNATVNEANRINAANLLATNLAQFNNLSQSRRDAMNFAFTASENAKDRAVQLYMAQMSADEAARTREQSKSNSMFSAIGSFLAAGIFG